MRLTPRHKRIIAIVHIIFSFSWYLLMIMSQFELLYSISPLSSLADTLLCLVSKEIRLGLTKSKFETIFCGYRKKKKFVILASKKVTLLPTIPIYSITIASSQDS
ncbi:uncharacterized protein DS421_5g163710 [Arachis hypogaea]|nr:uncharacterized protein DS421_5g163710 [Arachis hypogaea]